MICRVLRCAEFSPDLSFETIGGTSLAAVHVILLIESKYGVTIPLEEFFDAPNITSVAQLIMSALDSRKEDN